MKIFSIIREGEVVAERTNLRLAKDEAKRLGATRIVECDIYVGLDRQEITVVAYYVLGSYNGRFWYYSPSEYEIIRHYF